MPLNDRVAAATAALLISAGPALGAEASPAETASAPQPSAAPVWQLRIDQAQKVKEFVGNFAQEVKPGLSAEVTGFVADNVAHYTQELSRKLETGERQLGSRECGLATMLYKDKGEKDYAALDFAVNRQGSVVAVNGYRQGSAEAQARTASLAAMPDKDPEIKKDYRRVTGPLTQGPCPQ